jgi:uracil-DNA glycosylase
MVTIVPTYHPAAIMRSELRMQAFQQDFLRIRDVYRRLSAPVEN